jgi:hypothetical protein
MESGFVICQVTSNIKVERAGQRKIASSISGEAVSLPAEAVNAPLASHPALFYDRVTISCCRHYEEKTIPIHYSQPVEECHNRHQ